MVLSDPQCVYERSRGIYKKNDLPSEAKTLRSSALWVWSHVLISSLTYCAQTYPKGTRHLNRNSYTITTANPVQQTLNSISAVMNRTFERL